MNEEPFEMVTFSPAVKKIRLEKEATNGAFKSELFRGKLSYTQMHLLWSTLCHLVLQNPIFKRVSVDLACIRENTNHHSYSDSYFQILAASSSVTDARPAAVT